MIRTCSPVYCSLALSSFSVLFRSLPPSPTHPPTYSLHPTRAPGLHTPTPPHTPVGNRRFVAERQLLASRSCSCSTSRCTCVVSPSRGMRSLSVSFQRFCAIPHVKLTMSCASISHSTYGNQRRRQPLATMDTLSSAVPGQPRRAVSATSYFGAHASPSLGHGKLRRRRLRCGSSNGVPGKTAEHAAHCTTFGTHLLASCHQGGLEVRGRAVLDLWMQPR